MENLEIYDKYKSVPANALKDFDNGNFQGTDINTMWRIKSLTESFGICGIGWYYDIVRTWNEQIAEANTVLTFAEIKLYIKVDGEWSKGISGVGGNKMLSKIKPKNDGTGGYFKASDEAVKMAVTDALGNACRNLGFGADVYWANDKTKYTQVEKDEIVGGAFVLKGGKYDGKTIQEVYEMDRGYCIYCLEKSTNYIVKQNFKKCFADNGDILEVNV